MIAIGSIALARHTPLARPPGDLDYVATFKEFQDYTDMLKVRLCYPIGGGKKYIIKTKQTMVEIEIAWQGSTAAMLLDLVEKDPDTHNHYGCLYPSIHVLYALKMSHRFKKNCKHFLKTMQDIKLLRSLGAVIKPEHMEFYKARTAEQTSAHPKLNVSKENFFTENFQYVYDHDSIHEAVKHLARPAYWYFKPESKPVMTDRKMFEALPEHTKLLSVLEEAYVLAIERSQVPHEGKVGPEWSFLKAMEKVCTSITSGWWREFAWENYDKVVSMYNPDYVDRFRNSPLVRKHCTAG